MAVRDVSALGRAISAGARTHRFRLAAIAVSGIVLTSGCTGSHDTATSAVSSASSSAVSSSASSATPSKSSSKSSSAKATPTKSATKAKTPSIQDTVPSVSLATKSPVAISAPADFGNKVTAHVVSIKSFNATAHGIGEIAGPAVAITLTVTNGSKSNVNLGSVTVTLADHNGTPSNPLSGSPSKPFSGNVAPGKSASAVYVFSLAKNHANPVTISLSYTTEAPVVLFVGDAQ
jgi:hypothetical protein